MGSGVPWKQRTYLSERPRLLDSPVPAVPTVALGCWEGTDGRRQVGPEAGGVRGRQRLLVQGCATWHGRDLGAVVLGEAGLVDICLLSPPFSCERRGHALGWGHHLPWEPHCAGAEGPAVGRGREEGHGQQKEAFRAGGAEGGLRGRGWGGTSSAQGPSSPGPLLEHQDRSFSLLVMSAPRRFGRWLATFLSSWLRLCPFWGLCKSQKP